MRTLLITQCCSHLNNAKHRGFGTFSGMTNYSNDIIEMKMLGKAIRDRKRMELLHDMIERRDYRQFTDLISDKSKWRQDSK